MARRQTEENSESTNLERSQNPATNTPELEDSVRIGDDDDPEIGTYSKPEEPRKQNLEKDEIKEFFEKKGAVEILAQLSDGPKRFSEIDTAVVASHGTVANRLTEGAKLGLWKEYFHYPDDGGKTKLYELTPAAASLAESPRNKTSVKRPNSYKKASNDTQTP
ncbi:hypothetical protein [Haloarcula amylovorans]|uniref:hypothetical protein n=1 Tax=Haloarcula amylovorans TaxID=2562280 RepID=UPI001FD82115|nr:hypothetical protein [Halomicroarcula amylolytica]